MPDFVGFQWKQGARHDDDEIFRPPLSQVEAGAFGRKKGRVEETDGAEGSQFRIRQAASFIQAPFSEVIVGVDMKGAHELL